MLALYSVEEGGEVLAERRLCSMLRNKSIVKTKSVVKARVYVSSSATYGLCVKHCLRGAEIQLFCGFHNGCCHMRSLALRDVAT